MVWLASCGYGENVTDLFTHKCSLFAFRKVIQDSLGLVKTPFLLYITVHKAALVLVGTRESGVSLGQEARMLTEHQGLAGSTGFRDSSDCF